MESKSEEESDSIDRVALDKRNADLGLLLRRARENTYPYLTQDACARYLGTSRQRYAKFEAGTIPIPLVEYEAMLLYLEIPLSKVWPELLRTASPRCVLPVTLEPGQTVVVVLQTE
jgi:transcriptional regulator with XRE-family HTH domain